MLTGPRLPPASGGKPKHLVILLHGLGSDGNDLIGLAPYWAPLLPDTAFVSPNAPFPCDMAPYGYQWFSFLDRSPNRIQAGVQAAAPILDGFIDQELGEAGLAENDLALVGFSQGAMMALYVALRRARPVAQVLGYSGRIIGAERLAEEIRSRPPVQLVHGEADEVVPFESLAHAAASLKAAGVPVETLARPRLGHSIDEAGLKRGGERLVAAFSSHKALTGK
ncbi:MAG: prolyl oligopeptidase family serine peptidase [Proteobacteria bacterium]|nr:prolyl oligopeptidase family serine peptidase [Pseudomonadota bacterium]MBI3499420.1 prolyl oligopeptidase family serine peptidase [Pseudomonadota bacterium]